MSYFNVDILTPSKIIAKDVEADSVIIQTQKGMIEILPEHTHIIEKLATGELIVKKGTNVNKYFVTGGICKLLASKLHIMANICEPAAEIDKERAKKAMKLAKEKLSGSESLTEEDWKNYTRKLERAEVRLTIN